MKKTFVALAGLAVLSTAPVAAAAEENVFAGPYAGLEAGYNNIKIGSDLGSVKEDGFNYGVFAGYRYQLDTSILLGLEARLGESTASFSDGTATIDSTRQIGIDATIGTTLGSDDNILAFAFVGYDNLRMNTIVGTAETDVKLDGIRFGAGAEYAFGNNLSLRGTVAYTDYENDVRNIQLLTGLVYNF